MWHIAKHSKLHCHASSVSNINLCNETCAKPTRLNHIYPSHTQTSPSHRITLVNVLVHDIVHHYFLPFPGQQRSSTWFYHYYQKLQVQHRLHSNMEKISSEYRWENVLLSNEANVDIFAQNFKRYVRCKHNIAYHQKNTSRWSMFTDVCVCKCACVTNQDCCDRKKRPPRIPCSELCAKDRYRMTYCRIGMVCPGLMFINYEWNTR